MNYTLNQLRIFQKVATTLNITKAAAELHLTQPAVSIQLGKFQDQFDLPLLEIVHKRIYITDFGLEILDSANKILEEANGIRNKMHAFKGQLTGKLRFSIVSTAKYIAPYFLSDFMKDRPGIELVMDVTNRQTVLDNLERNEVDFALASVLPEKLKVEKVELVQNKLFVVGNMERNFGSKQNSGAVFEKIPLIYRERGSGTRMVMEKYIKGARLPVTKKMELTSNEAVKQAVIAGLGYSIMPLIGIRNELLNKQLQIIPVKGFPIKSTWSLIWLKNKKHTLPSKAYLDYLKTEKQKIIDSKFDWYENF
ncbi:MAG: LysR substrate-binding domain-containing protein [Bacteroidota bacterium]